MTTLSDESVSKLILLLKEKPRATRKSNRLYIDTGDNRKLVGLKRHTVIFGRRGSGKTMLLSELATAAKQQSVGLVWIDIDDYKTLAFPDILIQILRSIFQNIRMDVKRKNPIWQPIRRFRTREILSKLAKEEASLSKLLQRFEESDLSREESSSRKNGIKNLSDISADNNIVVAKRAESRTTEDVATMKEVALGRDRKIDHISRHLHDAKELLRSACYVSFGSYYVVLDDFYHLNVDDQSLVLDFLQSLTKNLDVFIKFGTIAHRSRLYRKENQIITGMQKEHDVLAIDLDRTFQNYSEVEQFIRTLWLQLLKTNEIESLESLFGGDSWKQIVLASGGTPRDFMNILAKALEIGRSRGKAKIDVLLVNEASNLYLRETKHEDLVSDGKHESGELENMLMDIRRFCVDEKKRNLFLIDKDAIEKNQSQFELLRQLLDYRFIHLVHGNTSVVGRKGRFEAYLLDVGLYSYPQRRGKNKVRQVDFLQRDEQHRADAVRTQPIYTLRDSYIQRIGDPFAPLEEIPESESETNSREEKDDFGQMLLDF
jgi:Cdc6-like AAA superfamily ATPase